MDTGKIMGIMAAGTVGTGISRPGKNTVIDGAHHVRPGAVMTGIAGERSCRWIMGGLNAAVHVVQVSMA
jgi:hypothetical protein